MLQLQRWKILASAIVSQEEGFLLGFFLAVLAIASQISFFLLLLLLVLLLFVWFWLLPPPVLAELLAWTSRASLTKNFNLHRVVSLYMMQQ